MSINSNRKFWDTSKDAKRDQTVPALNWTISGVLKRLRIVGLVLLVAISSFATVSAQWKEKLKLDIESTWPPSKVGLDRLRITQAGTVFVIKKDGITGDLAKDSTFTKNTVEGGHILAPKGAVAFLQGKQTSRPFKVGDKVYLWKIAMDDDELALFLISYETFTTNERGGRSLQTRYKALLDFKFEKSYLPSADFASVKELIAQIIVPESEAQASATKTISLGQTTAEVEGTLGRPERIVNLGPKVTYVYKDMKVIFQDGKVADVQ